MIEDTVYSIEPIEEKVSKLIRAELDAGVPRKDLMDQDEWLKRFASLWLACEKIHREEPREALEKPVQPERSHRHSAEVLAELGKGKVVIGDSFLHPQAPKPDDLIVFDIDPELAIKWWTASRGLGL